MIKDLAQKKIQSLNSPSEISSSATGIATSAGASTVTPLYSQGSVTPANTALYALTVTGLGFTPSMVVVHNTATNEVTVFTTRTNFNSQGVTTNTAISYEWNQTIQAWQHNSSSAAPGTFTIYVMLSGSTYNWYAYA